LLTRVYHRRRRVEHPARYLDAAVAEAPVGAYVNIEIARADDRPARTARLAMRWCGLAIRPPANYLGAAPAHEVRLWFVQASEQNCPPGQSPVEWLLATTLPVEDARRAAETINWYARRWMIERFHFVLKSGCKIEERMLASAERMQCLLATYSLVAWHLLHLTYAARQSPEASCESVLEPEQWQVLHLATRPRTPLPKHPPTLADAVAAIGRLGGFLGRRHDGRPGVKCLWRGWQRLIDLVAGYRLARGP
jgi:IS4 transposase